MKIFQWTESGSDWGVCVRCNKHFTNCSYKN